MAAGDIVWFDQALVELGSETFNLAADTIKLGLVKSAANSGIDPSAATSDPCWGAGGSTNLSSYQVATGGTSYTGPITLASVTWALASGKAKLDAADVTINADASGFTNARWGIIYDDSATDKNALGYVDLGGDKSIASANLVITWNASGILTLDQA